jgi:hypothetical protein
MANLPTASAVTRQLDEHCIINFPALGIRECLDHPFKTKHIYQSHSTSKPSQSNIAFSLSENILYSFIPSVTISSPASHLLQGITS